MEKIYGYKEKDIIGLADFLKMNENRSLSQTFKKYGELNDKAKGPVRNLYYALAKRSNFDTEFCEKYLGGKPISVAKIVEFDQREERELIKKILLAKKDGRSVRNAIIELSGGDAKLSLRYQNKFRNAMKNKPALIADVIKELKEQGVEIKFDATEKTQKPLFNESQLVKLKDEIDTLVGKIASKVKKENEYLKQRIIVLEKENQKLRTLLYGQTIPSAKEYFKKNQKEEFIN